MKNEPDYTITISRRFTGGDAYNVERVIKNAKDGEVIYTSLHSFESDSEKEAPVAHLEKHLGLYPPENKFNADVIDAAISARIFTFLDTSSEMDGSTVFLRFSSSSFNLSRSLESICSCFLNPP